MSELKTGTTVRLKSGGPLMTVSAQTDYGSYECYWFNTSGGEHTPKWETFKPEMLKVVELRD